MSEFRFLRSKQRRLVAVLALAVPAVVAAQESDPLAREALFGDLHIHTMFSFDAFMGSVRTTPDDAYRYAKGEAIDHPDGSKIRVNGPPLDFLTVSDHAEFLGVFAALIDPNSPTYGHPATDEILGQGGFVQAAAIVRQLASEGDSIASDEVVGSAWGREIEAANRHNEPGKFTALIGYEYTPSVGSRHLHRNVIFRGSKVPMLPFSSLDSGDPEDLWTWLDALREEGIEAMAIPHNMNQSDGLAFPERTWKDQPIDAAFAEKRMRNEPVAEISQKKGTSEVHPSLSPNDEWADFQIVQYYLNRRENKDPISIFKGGYYRDALKTGLEMEESVGSNPYQLGIIASSDSHVSAAPYEESSLFSGRSNTPESRGSSHGDRDAGWEGFVTPRQATHGTGGLAAVWAEENTRASIYDAMRRRETFGTSGPRIRVRFFGGFGLDRVLAQSDDLIATSYAEGVPMGGVLPPDGRGAPSFLLWAMRDPRTTWLERAQVIKGWVEDGNAQEKIYDIACSDGANPDPQTHRCPYNGAQVDLSDCSISTGKGDVELQAIWKDPDFDPAQRAFYYVRVLENPTCRWSTWDALRLGIEPNPDLQKTQQQRAWGSPIWYSPTG